MTENKVWKSAKNYLSEIRIHFKMIFGQAVETPVSVSFLTVLCTRTSYTRVRSQIIDTATFLILLPICFTAVDLGNLSAQLRELCHTGNVIDIYLGQHSSMLFSSLSKTSHILTVLGLHMLGHSQDLT